MDLHHPLTLALASFFASLGLTRLSLPLARLVGALDRPGPIKIHAAPVPRLGGLGFVGTVSAVGVLSGVLPPLVLAGLLLIAAVGFLDDRFSLLPWVKLGGQAASGAVLALHFARSGAPAWVSAGAFALVVVFANAVNLLDGMDGLAAGCSLISCAALALIDAAVGLEVGTEAALAGALAGFLPWNYPPARTFMGDVGSLAIGYLLAFSVSRLAGSGAAPWLAGVGTLTIPLCDMALGVLRRFRAGRPIFEGDRGHFYDKIQRLTGDGVATIWIAFAATGASVLVWAVGAPRTLGAALPRIALLAVACAWAARRLRMLDSDPG